MLRCCKLPDMLQCCKPLGMPDQKLLRVSSKVASLFLEPWLAGFHTKSATCRQEEVRALPEAMSLTLWVSHACSIRPSNFFLPYLIHPSPITYHQLMTDTKPYQKSYYVVAGMR